MKKTKVLSLAMVVFAASTLVLGILLWQSKSAESSSEVATKVQASDTNTAEGNYSDEMKIEYAVDLSPEDGADSVEREGDHVNSPYFSNLDFYNMESTDTLTILSNFKTIQQTSEWSCGVTSSLMVLNYYGKLDDWNEKTLAQLRSDHSDIHPGTCLVQVQEIFDAVGGFTYDSTEDFTNDLSQINLSMIREYLEDGIPVMIAWNDWGGHWQVIIGYDDMGTETEQDDVIIVADPYDTTDHNQDGYGVYGAERFYYNFTMYDFFGEDELNDMIFLAAKPLS